MKIVGSVVSENRRGARALVWHVERQADDRLFELLFTPYSIGKQLHRDSASSCSGRTGAKGKR